MNPIQTLIESRKVVVICGAGGVGKTTTAASLALAAARAGKKVLVVTIDPSKRLAETLGVSRNPATPIELDRAVQQAIGIEAPGSLWAWMLDPQKVSDDVVRKFSKSDADAERLLQNPIYGNVSAMVAGMQEYTAVESLHGFALSGEYDLIVLDTPPSRNALHFLEAPTRVGAFLDRRIFNLFVPGEGGLIRRVATRLIEGVMDAAFGKQTRQDLQVFLNLFGNLFGQLNQNQAQMRAFFSSPAVAFVLVTSPAREALEEARHFEQHARETLNLPLAGYLLNRSLSWAADWPAGVGDGTDPSLVSALEKLEPLAERERRQVSAHTALAEDLSARLAGTGFVGVLPMLTRDASELDALTGLAEALISEEICS